MSPSIDPMKYNLDYGYSQKWAPGVGKRLSPKLQGLGFRDPKPTFRPLYYDLAGQARDHAHHSNLWQLPVKELKARW